MQVCQKTKTKDLNSPRNEPLIVLDCWSNKIEEYFHLSNPGKIILSDKFTRQDVINVMNTMVKHVKSMEQGMIGLQEKFIESKNDRLKQSISIYQMILENISTKKTLRQLLYLINGLHERVKK